MADIITPAGRLVQGKLAMQQRKDTKTKQPLFKDAAKTIPDMGLFFSLAFPKVLPNGQPNVEFDAFFGKLKQEAATAWPQFFPQGAGGSCTNPKFSWKYQDGDGTDTNGQSVAGKPGFKGHHIIKFDTNYPVSAFHQGQYRPDQEIGVGPNAPKLEDVIKRGYWVIVHGEAKSNNADLSQQQVPGISIYPKLVSFLGGRAEDEIKSGPDAQAVFGAMQQGGWRPDGISAVPGAPVGTVGVGMPGLPLPGGVPGLPSPGVPSGLPIPGLVGGLPLPPPVITAPVAPVYVVRADLAEQGHTLATLAAHGTPDQLVAAGYLTVQAPTLGLPLPGVLPTPPVVTGPVYQLIATLAKQGVTMDALKAKGWTEDALVQAGHAIKIG